MHCSVGYVTDSSQTSPEGHCMWASQNKAAGPPPGVAPATPGNCPCPFLSGFSHIRSSGEVSFRAGASESQSRKNDSDSGLGLQKGMEWPLPKTLSPSPPVSQSPPSLGACVCVNLPPLDTRANGPELAQVRILVITVHINLALPFTPLGTCIIYVLSPFNQP